MTGRPVARMAAFTYRRMLDGRDADIPEFDDGQFWSYPPTRTFAELLNDEV